MTQRSFHPLHLEDLRKSGLGDEIIDASEVYSVRPDDISRILGWEPQEVESALAFPYPGTDGFQRLKVFPPIKDKKGHSIKYLQRKNTGAHLYILPIVQSILSDPNIPLGVAEGEKKTLALIESGIMAVGIGGVWNWIDGETHMPISEISKIDWRGRKVTLYFDSDIWSRKDLLRPVYALGKELEEQGAQVEVAVLENEN